MKKFLGTACEIGLKILLMPLLIPLMLIAYMAGRAGKPNPFD